MSLPQIVYLCLQFFTGEGFPELDKLTRWLPELAKLYGELAIEQNTYFVMHAAQLCEADPVDGLHLDVENCFKLGVGIAKALAIKGFARLIEKRVKRKDFSDLTVNF